MTSPQQARCPHLLSGAESRAGADAALQDGPGGMAGRPLRLLRRRLLGVCQTTLLLLLLLWLRKPRGDGGGSSPGRGGEAEGAAGWESGTTDWESVPILVLAQGELGIARTLESLRERLPHFPRRVAVAFLDCGADIRKRDVRARFGVSVIDFHPQHCCGGVRSGQRGGEQLLRERSALDFNGGAGLVHKILSHEEEEDKRKEGGCLSESFEKVRRKVRFLNTRVNSTELVDFYPKLSDRDFTEGLFVPLHSHVWNPAYQMYFKNSYEKFLSESRSPATPGSLKNYFVKNEKVEILEDFFEKLPRGHLDAGNHQSRKKLSNHEERKTEIENQESQNFGDVTSAKFGSATSGDCEIFRRFKKILRIFLDQNPTSEKFVLADDRHVFAPDLASYFAQSLGALDQDASLYCVAAAPPLPPATLPPHAPYPTRTAPSPPPPSTPPPFLASLPPSSLLRRVDHFVGGGGAVGVRRALLREILEHFAPPLAPPSRAAPRPPDFLPSTRGVHGPPDPAPHLLETLGDWLSWRRLLRGCAVPALARACPATGVRPGGDGALGPCSGAGRSHVPLVAPQSLVRPRYYQALYRDLARATVLPRRTNASCFDPEFYPQQIRAGTALLLPVKMLSYGDDFSLRRVFECFGIRTSASPLTNGQFDGIFTLQLPEATRLYILGVPLTRLTPEVAVEHVVHTQLGGPRRLDLRPEAEYGGSSFVWDSIDVVRGGGD